jgi:predicted acylesterase/phospholipase RssA
MSSAAAKGIFRIPSFAFSGAALLTCYHLGVADCLIKHGVLLKQGEMPKDSYSGPQLTGVSGGALVAAAVSMDVHLEDGMKATLAIADRARQAGTLGHLQPGYVEINETDLECCWMHSECASHSSI